MKIQCPDCDQKIEVDESLCGQSANCPACSSEFVIPHLAKNLDATDSHSPPAENTDSHQDLTQPSGGKTSKVLLWNPNAAVNWSVLFSPLFGIILHYLNWKSLKREREAKGQLYWMIGFVVMLVATEVIPSFNIESVGLFFLIAWYFIAAKNQANYVKKEIDNQYTKKSFGVPIAIGIVSVVMLIGVIWYLPSYEPNEEVVDSEDNSAARDKSTNRDVPLYKGKIMFRSNAQDRGAMRSHYESYYEAKSVASVEQLNVGEVGELIGKDWQVADFATHELGDLMAVFNYSTEEVVILIPANEYGISKSNIAIGSKPYSIIGTYEGVIDGKHHMMVYGMTTRHKFYNLEHPSSPISGSNKAEEDAMLDRIANMWPLNKDFPKGLYDKLDKALIMSAAVRGDASAQFYVGHFALVEERNESKAKKWFKKSAEQGYTRGQSFYGMLCENEQEALIWYRKAAEGDDSYSQFVVAAHHLNKGNAEDLIIARRLFIKAAVRGHKRSQWSLGRMYFVGEGCTKNEEEAVKWFQKSAEQGLNSGQYYLGLMYKHGRGIEKNVAEADKWMSKALAQGYDSASEADNWMSKALAQGHDSSKAQNNPHPDSKEGIGKAKPNTKKNVAAELAIAKADLAQVEVKIDSERARWKNALNVINTLTKNKTKPVVQGSRAYHKCLAASKIIKEVESGAGKLKTKKAGLEARIKALEAK